MKLRHIADLFTDKLWTMDTTHAPRIWRHVVRFVKLIRITVGTFNENNMGFQCVALSYFMFMAIIPFMAFVFAVGNGLGLSDRLSELLHRIIPTYSDLIDTIMVRADAIIETAQSGWVGFIGALAFFWTIIWLMFQVERVFNNVWGIHKVPRKIYKRFSFYIFVLILSPFLIIIFGYGIVYYTNMTNLIGLDLGDVKVLPKILTYIAFYVLTALTFSAMYKYIPATLVHYRNAIRAALVSALVFVLYQYLYLEAQILVTRFNAVYGAIAAIPLFLIWINWSWQIIIYGAELTYGFQNVDSYHIPEWDDEKDNGRGNRKK